MIVLSSLVFSIKIIYDSFEDWDENPLITSVEDFEAPLNNVEFPAITVGHEPSYQTDNWALPEIIFNFFEFTCSMKSDDCKKSEALRADFKPFLDDIYNIITEMIDEINVDEKSLQQNEEFPMDHVEIVLQAILNNETTLEDLEDTLKDSIGKYSYTHSAYKDFVEVFLNNDNDEPKTTIECKNNCVLLKSNVTKFMLKVLALDLPPKYGFGTLLRSFASDIGTTFGEFYSNKKGKNVEQCLFNQKENILHSLMVSLNKNLTDTKVTLFDVPSLFKVRQDEDIQEIPAHNIPIHSLCSYSLAAFGNITTCSGYTITFGHTNFSCFGGDENGALLPFCDWLWYDILEKSNETLPDTHPFYQYPNDFCTNGIENMTRYGSNLASLMKIMKFAHHLSTIKDVEYVYKRLKEMNLPYDIVDFKRVIRPKYYDIANGRSFIMRTKAKEATKFRTTITNAGISSIWNGMPISKVFKDSEYMTKFKETFADEDDDDDDGIVKADKTKVKTFYLDKHEEDFYDRFPSEQSFW